MEFQGLKNAELHALRLELFITLTLSMCLVVFDSNHVAFIRCLQRIEFDDSFDVTKSLQQIEIPDLLHFCTPCSELPSNISTMDFNISLSDMSFSSHICFNLKTTRTN